MWELVIHMCVHTMAIGEARKIYNPIKIPGRKTVLTFFFLKNSCVVIKLMVIVLNLEKYKEKFILIVFSLPSK